MCLSNREHVLQTEFWAKYFGRDRFLAKSLKPFEVT